MSSYIDTWMRIQTEYISVKNCWMKSISYDFKVHQQYCQRTCFSLTALQWFDVHHGLWWALPGLLSALPGHVIGAPRLVVGTPRLVAGTPRCSQACHRRFQMLPWLSPNLLYSLRFLPVLPGAPEGHCINPANSGILPPWDSGPTTPRHSQRLPVTKMHFAEGS